MNSETRALAFDVRATWMEIMGFDRSEIDAACRDDGSAIDLDDELDNFCCAEKLKSMTTSDLAVSSACHEALTQASSRLCRKSR